VLRRFRLLLVFFLFRLFWLTEAISIFIIVVIEFLFVLGVLPVSLLALNTELQMSVNILLFYLWLALLDKKRKFVV
jgi:hypothetical protein